MTWHSTALFSQDIVTPTLEGIETFFHVRFQPPQDFVNLNTAMAWYPNSKYYHHFFNIYLVFESEDKQCKVLYRVDMFIEPEQGEELNFQQAGNQIFRELWRIYESGNRDTTREDSSFVIGIYPPPSENLRDHIRIMPVDKAKRKFNADYVFMYDVPTAPFFGDFTHCIRMVITKASDDRAILNLVWYFTDEGIKNKEYYMEKVSGRIWYNESPWVRQVANHREWSLTHFSEFHRQLFHNLGEDDWTGIWSPPLP